MIELVETGYGAYICPDDPGEPGTGARRISVTKDEADLLAYLASGKKVLEIGTGLAVSTKAMGGSSWRMWTVDIDPWVHENVWDDLPGKIATSWEVPDKAPGYFDFCFIDGRHTKEALEVDLDIAHRLVTKGMIVCHDVLVPFDPEWHIIETHHGLAIKFVGWD